jgi:hypothetical protein
MAVSTLRGLGIYFALSECRWSMFLEHSASSHVGQAAKERRSKKRKSKERRSHTTVVQQADGAGFFSVE